MRPTFRTTAPLDLPLPACPGVHKRATDPRFTIVTADAQGEAESRALVERSGMPDPERVNVVDLRSQKGISIWIRDSMFPVQRADGSWKILIQDRTYWPGPEDNRVPTAVDAANEDIEAVSHPALRIDGGNAVSTRQFAIIGNDSFQHTTDRVRELSADPAKMAEITSFYEARTGQRVVEHPSRPTAGSEAGGRMQPWS